MQVVRKVVLVEMVELVEMSDMVELVVMVMVKLLDSRMGEDGRVDGRVEELANMVLDGRIDHPR